MEPAAPARPRTVVVGGGVAGLAAAHALVAAGESLDDVLVLEASDEVGGILRRREVAGVPVDVGAEAMLNRRPEGVDLARSVGLEPVHPAVVSSQVWSRGALRPMPRSMLGVPLDRDALAASGVLSEEGLARALAETDSPVAGDDVSIGDLVDERLGREVTDRLVEPLLGGVYAGHAREISAACAAPQVLAAARAGRLLDLDLGGGSATYAAPVFAGLAGGMGTLPPALAAGLRVRTGAVVRGLERTASGFALTVGPATAPERVGADRVVLALPAAPAARLLAGVAPDAATVLAGIETASVVVCTFAFLRRDLPPGALHEHSGVLVPPVEGRRIKASTFSSTKWGWTREAGRGAADGEDVVFVRTSLGRHREEASLQVDDAGLVAASLADLHDLVGLTARPLDVHVQRWGGALPQYSVGHRERIARARAAVARVPGLGVCGASYDGVGIPAVIASARAAVAGLAPTP